MTIPHVVKGHPLRADAQNSLIDQVNENTSAIQSLAGLDLEDVEALIETHAESATPHLAYDDMADLTLLFENGLF